MVKRVKISSVVESQLPAFVREDFPRVASFLQEYYKSLESESGTLDILQNIDKYIKVEEMQSGCSLLVSERHRLMAIRLRLRRPGFELLRHSFKDSNPPLRTVMTCVSLIPIGVSHTLSERCIRFWLWVEQTHAVS